MAKRLLILSLVCGLLAACGGPQPTPTTPLPFTDDFSAASGWSTR